MLVDDLGDVTTNSFEARRAREILALQLSQPGLHVGQDARLIRLQSRKRLLRDFEDGGQLQVMLSAARRLQVGDEFRQHMIADGADRDRHRP